MKQSDIQSILARAKTRVVTSTNTIKASSYSEKFGALAQKLFNYSKRVLELEGINENPTPQEGQTATDLALARAIKEDVAGNGWEGSGQAIMKIFSIFLRRNLNSKEIGLTCKLNLPKYTIVKHNDGKVGIISPNNNLLVISGNKVIKHSSFNRTNQEMNVATVEEITIFLGEVFSNETLTKSLGTALNVTSIEEFEQGLDVSNNGINVENYDQYEYKQFMVDINPDITQGVAV